MKKFLSVLCTTILVLSLAGVAGAESYSFQPDPVDLYDLDHHRYYTWGLDPEIPEGETIIGASLFFDDIGNWDDNENVLYLHLLDLEDPGVTFGWDDQGGGDNFAGQGILLNEWHNLPYRPMDDPSWGIDITYNFEIAEIATLNNYLEDDGIFGFGFDPDCHFWNEGIELTLITGDPVIPEPSTMLLVGLGLIGLVGLGRKRIKK